MTNRGFDPASGDEGHADGDRRDRRPLDRVAERAGVASVTDGGVVIFEDGERLVFNSMNFLGLTADERVQRAATEAAVTVGTGSGGPRGAGGDTLVHHDLEQRIARTIGCERTLVFPSRFQTLVSTLYALDPDVVFGGVRYLQSVASSMPTGTTVVPYPDGDFTALEARLDERDGSDPNASESWLVIAESIDRLDGTTGNLTRLVELATDAGAWTLVDESAAIGLFADGGGVIRAEGLEDRVDVQIGSLGTALASQGGYVGADAAVIELIATSNGFIETGAITPVAAATATEALHVARFGDHRDRLWENVRHFNDGLAAMGIDVPGDSPVLVVPVGSDVDARDVVEAMAERGVLVRSMGNGQAAHRSASSHDRLVITPMATHESSDVVACLEAIQDVFVEFGLLASQ